MKKAMTADLGKIQQAASALCELFGRYKELSYEEIEAGVQQATAGLNLVELKGAARLAGMRAVPASAGLIRRKLYVRIAERKGRHERGEEIGRIARQNLHAREAGQVGGPVVGLLSAVLVDVVQGIAS